MANLRKWILALAIAIVFNFFINYGVNLFYATPQTDAFCNEQRMSTPYAVPAPLTKTGIPETPQCQTVTASPELQSNCTQQKGYIAFKYNATGCPTDSYCDLCQAKTNVVSSNVFIILLIAGIIAFVLGLTLKADAVSMGFLIGGLLSMVIAAIRTWGQLQNVFKLVIIGVALIVLIWLGYKKGTEKPK